MSTKAAKRKHVAGIRRRSAERRRRRAGRRRETSAAEHLPGSALALPKMSDTLLAFAAPLLEGAETEDDYRSAIGLASIAWNCAYLPDEAWHRAIPACAAESGLSALDAQMFEEMVGPMVAMKRELFDWDERFVVDFELTLRRNQPHLRVQWTRVDAEDEADAHLAQPETRYNQLELV